MKYYWFIFISSLSIISCSQTSDTEVSTTVETFKTTLELPQTTTSQLDIIHDKHRGLWLLDSLPYSGYVVDYYNDGTLKSKFGVLNGQRQNKAITYYPDSHYQFISNYYKGKLHGEKKMWSSDSTHVLISHLNFHLGKGHGEQKKWYPTGEIFKIMHLKMGREEGIQQAFRKNGDLYANYEAKEGRIFGLKKSTLCYGLEDEEVQYKN